MSHKKSWARNELILAFTLYCRTPFGRLHKTNPEIIQLAAALNRTPSSVAMKLVNYASLDPAQKARNIKGLANASKEDRKIWGEFHSHWEEMIFESQKAYSAIFGNKAINKLSGESEKDFALLITEGVRATKTRLVQHFFREAVLASYGSQCALCRLAITELLNASHIIPWSIETKRRADPTNGIALCALHDRAFDRGFIAIGDTYTILVSKRLKANSSSLLHKVGLLDIEGEEMFLPSRFLPDKAALSYHRETIFKA